jgi:predicted phage-related endonuclease
MQIIKCEPHSEEWFQARLGSIGGSSISSVMAKGKGKMRKNLLYRLAGEIVSGQSYEGYSNHHMLRGTEEEQSAIDAYQFITDRDVYNPGIVKQSSNKHYSPDGLCDPDGIIECKSAIPSIHIERIDTDKIEGNYIKQMQWGLFICERNWADFVSYSPLVKSKFIWIKRIERDEKLIKEMNEECDKFLFEMITIIKKVEKNDRE